MPGLDPALQAVLARSVSSMFHFETELIWRRLLASPLPSIRFAQCKLRGEGEASLTGPVR
jgi:hypothetical protein